MNEIVFEGPLHSSSLDDPKKDLNFEGVYIWGFMVDKDFKPINCVKKHEYKPDEMNFLPYYVGMATGKGKNGMTVKKRLKSHKEVRKGDGAKYTRINESQFKSFHKDVDFPVHVGNRQHHKEMILYYMKCKGNAIPYFNNPLFMLHQYEKQLTPKVLELFNKSIKSDLPITSKIFEGISIKDPLFNVVCNKDNFWFVCANAKHLDHKNDESYFENLEGITYFSLKGKTISKTKPFKDLSWDNFKLIDNTNTNIFKDQPSGIFLGYL
jgi:hypothetical protein